jgi:hypothetical membrane protein
MSIDWDDRQKAGLALFAGTVQFAVGLTLAEVLHSVSSPSGYSMSGNYISDLGVGPAAIVFNGSIILLGVTLLAAAWFLLRVLRDRIFPIVIAIAGIGAVGVGIFTETFPLPHTVFSFIAFSFSALSAILAFRILRSPLNYLSVGLGVVSLVALIFFVTSNYAGLGNGGMERMIVWPVLAWAIAFSGYLLAAPPTTEPAAT